MAMEFFEFGAFLDDGSDICKEIMIDIKELKWVFVGESINDEVDVTEVILADVHDLDVWVQ